MVDEETQLLLQGRHLLIDAPLHLFPEVETENETEMYSINNKMKNTK